jgi:acyl CoA:acetate/3-ketoacid CoA transferase
MPSKTMLGSQLLDRLVDAGDVLVANDPFGSGPVVMLAALHPDLAVVHADVADEAGNAAVSGPTWSIREVAFAARAVVIVAEAIVPVGELDAGRTLIPGSVVDAVVEAPGGAHPTAVFGHYDYDRRHLERYAESSKQGPDALAGYVDRFIRGVRDHREYLAMAEAS